MIVPEIVRGEKEGISKMFHLTGIFPYDAVVIFIYTTNLLNLVFLKVF